MTVARRLLLPAFLLLCLILGGASRGGYFANMALQIMGTGLIVWSLWSKPAKPLDRQERVLLGIVLAGCLIILFQFVPLPLSVWETLGSRGAIAEIDRLAGFEPDPAFVSLMPYNSLKSAVWILPALGLLLAMLRLRNHHAKDMVWVILAVVTISVLLGALQITGGPQSLWYFYQRTNYGSTVGFFSNSNHLATLLLVSIPFLAALLGKPRSRRSSKREALFLLGGGLLTVVIVGVFVNGSLLGYGLLLPVLVASAMILVPKSRLRRLTAWVLVPAVLLGTVLVLTTDEGLRLIAHEDAQELPSARSVSGSRDVVHATTARAIPDFLPTGSGLGSFAEIYPHYEDPSGVSRQFRNHAHNDYLEILLETGLPGGLVLAVFLIWWCWRAHRIWTAKDATPLACAAVIASATILVHSIVDYPLRTAAVSTVFAFCLVLMTTWVSGDRIEMHRRSE